MQRSFQLESMQFRWTFAWFEEIASDWFVDEICLGPEISAFGTHVCVTLAFRDLVCAILSRPSKDFSSDKRNSKGLQVIEFASRQNTRQNKTFIEGVFRIQAVEQSTVLCKSLDSALSIVVIPRNAVVIKACEHLGAGLLKPLFITVRNRRV